MFSLILFHISKEIDLIATGLSITYPRSLVIAFTSPYAFDPMMFIIPYPKLDSTINRIAKPFQYEVGNKLFQ